MAADQVLAGELAGPAGAVAFGTYGAVGRAACQSASELPSSLRATMAAIPPMATTMASRFSHLPFGFGAADLALSSGRATALPRSVASTTSGAAAAAARASASFGQDVVGILVLAASTAGGTLSSASSNTGPNLSTASWATRALRCLADLRVRTDRLTDLLGVRAHLVADDTGRVLGVRADASGQPAARTARPVSLACWA